MNSVLFVEVGRTLGAVEGRKQIKNIRPENTSVGLVDVVIVRIAV